MLAAGRLDQAVLLALRTRGHRPAVERIAQGLGSAGAAPAAVGLNYLVKLAVGRNRPVIEGHPPLGPAPNKLSFPSAHSTTALTAATVLARVAPGARLPLYSLAALICVGRPYLGMHYPSDVLAGAALGYALGRAYPLPPEPPQPPADDRAAIEATP